MVIVFDMDDTLYPESSFVLSALAEAGKYAEDKWGYKDFQSTLIKLFLLGEKTNLFQQAALSTRCPDLQPAQIEELLTCYRNHQPSSLPWHADALELIPQLAKSYPLGLISDGYLPVQSNKANALGVQRWFKEIIFTEELGRMHWKPAPTAFNLMMQRFPGEKFIYIGDNPRKDFVAPRQLGWQTIQILRPDGQYVAVTDQKITPADYQVKDLRFINDLLR
jgi:putative hydrolase of the HAD superfamily